MSLGGWPTGVVFCPIEKTSLVLRTEGSQAEAQPKWWSGGRPVLVGPLFFVFTSNVEHDVTDIGDEVERKEES